MIGAFRRIPYPRSLAAAAVVLAIYLLLGFLLAPRLIERAIPDFAAEKLQRTAKVGSVRFNPLLFRLEVNNFVLAERDGVPIVGFDRLLVNFELSSLARWAWTFSDIQVDGLALRVDIRPDGKLNLAELAASLPQQEDGEPRDSAPPRLLLQHVALNGGTISFSDRSAPTPASVAIQLDLDLRDISTLPDHRGPYSVSVGLRGGGTLRWRGEVSLQPISSRGEVEVKGVRPEIAWRFLRDRLNLAEPAGTVDFSARYRFEYAGNAPQFAAEDMRYAATGITLTESGAKEPLLALETIEATGGRFDLASRELVLPVVEVHKGVVFAETDARGALNWQRIVKDSPAAGPDSEPAPEGAPWKIRVEAVRVGGVALRYIDRSRAIPVSAGVGGFDAVFAAEVETGGGRTRVLVSGLALDLARMTLGEIGAKQPLASIDAVALQGGSFDLEKRRVAIQRVTVKGPAASIVREKDGGLRIVDALGAADRGKPRSAAPTAPRQARKETGPWRFSLDAFDIEGGRIALADRGYEPAVAYDLENVRATVRNITNDVRTPLKFDAALRVAQGGAVRTSGNVADGGGRVIANVKVEHIALKPLQPLVALHSTLRLESGEVSADAKVEYRAGKQRPELRVTGGAGIENLLLNEADGGERLLAWKALAANGISFSLEPDRLRMEEVRLLEPGAKIVIFKDRSLNLVKAFKSQAAPAPAGAAPGGDTPKPAAGNADAPAASAPSFDVGVERVRIENGVVDFADLSLVLPFAAKVEEFQGTATGISSDPASGAALQLEGKVGEFGLARVDGTLKPFQPKVHADIGVVFANVDMMPFSPYSATFAGRKIASGQLSLDLRYKVENSQLAGDHKVVMDRFTLGETVESPGALNLPYDLAIALLTDSDGKINVAVPVKGNVDAPDFSYGHLIWQAISTVITNIVTVPFRALASLFGGSGESPETIAFDAGRATLQPPEREKLKRVAEVLGKRPQLTLLAEGQYGDADRAALRQRDVALAVAGKLGRQPAPEGLPEPVNPLEARTQRALEALFVERESEAALSGFAAETEKARGKPVQRVNPVLALAGRGSPDTAYYQAMLGRLNDRARIPDTAPAQLADARARAVGSYLVETLSVPAARVTVKTAAEPGEVRVNLSFDVARQAQKPESRGAQ
jgi:hypothetical protein